VPAVNFKLKISKKLKEFKKILKKI